MTPLRLLTAFSDQLCVVLQFVDDILDFTSSSKVMGKPALNDLKSGLATAPVLFAAEEYPELSPLIQRRFQNDGDVNLAQKLVFRSRGIERTRELAAEHASLAAEKVLSFLHISLFLYYVKLHCRPRHAVIWDPEKGPKSHVAKSMLYKSRWIIMILQSNNQSKAKALNILLAGSCFPTTAER